MPHDGRKDDRLKDYKPSKKWIRKLQEWERKNKTDRKKKPVKPSGHKARIERMKKKKKK